MPSLFKDLSASIFCFIQMVFRLNLTQLHCVLRSTTSYYFKNTLQLLTIHTPPHVANNTDFQKVYSHSVVTAYSLKVSVNSIAQCKDPTVIGTFAIILFAMITVCSLEIQLALLQPLANFFTPILFYSHAFQFVYHPPPQLQYFLDPKSDFLCVAS